MRIIKNSKKRWMPCTDPNDKIDWGKYYMVNVHGDIKSIPREVNCGEYTRMIAGKILKVAQREKGKHVSVNFAITLEGKRHIKTAYPHRYVALMYIPNDKRYKYVSHRRDKKGLIDYTNNHVSNLYWANQSRISKETMKTYPELRNILKDANTKSGYYWGKRSRKISLSDEDIESMKHLRSQGKKYREIAIEFGISISTAYKYAKSK